MRNRFMFYLTGMPGWMRFGFSPGWLGRSPTGLGPCAEYFLTGRWPSWATPAWSGWQPWWSWSGPATVAPGFLPGTFASGQLSELEILRRQAEWLKGQLGAIQQRIAELEKEQQ